MSVNKLIKDGKSTIPYVVEGANLFFTQDAKLRLEAAGCIFIKDASANKGGVTSSSLEVLASLAFDNDGFVENMCVREDGRVCIISPLEVFVLLSSHLPLLNLQFLHFSPSLNSAAMGNANFELIQVPEFYKAYVREVQDIIRRNARLEFEAIWREHERTGIPRSNLSDSLSVAITELDEELQRTELWQNVGLRRAVLRDAIPKLLLRHIRLDLIMERVSVGVTKLEVSRSRCLQVPENYLRAIFGSYLASRFVYEFGFNPGQFAFFDL